MGALMTMQPQPARPLNYEQVNLFGMTFAFLLFIYRTPAPSAMNVKVKNLRSERLEEGKISPVGGSFMTYHISQWPEQQKTLKVTILAAQTRLECRNRFPDMDICWTREVITLGEGRHNDLPFWGISKCVCDGLSRCRHIAARQP